MSITNTKENTLPFIDHPTPPVEHFRLVMSTVVPVGSIDRRLDHYQPQPSRSGCGCGNQMIQRRRRRRLVDEANSAGVQHPPPHFFQTVLFLLLLVLHAMSFSPARTFPKPRGGGIVRRNFHQTFGDSAVGAVNHPQESIKQIPRHVGIVCDGNSRWATAHHLPTISGHLAGAERLVDVLTVLRQQGVKYCTLFGFSTENWQRSDREVQDILRVMEQTARQFYARAVQEQVCIRILGDLQDERIPNSLRSILLTLEKDTANRFSATRTTAVCSPGSSSSLTTNNLHNIQQQQFDLTLCIAVNYGGRQDIVQATQRLCQLVADGTLHPDEISPDVFASALSTAGLPDPDLIIRTSGESRLSNFLLWDAAYAELYFTDTYWPDFDATALQDALEWYAQRRRRFGARQTSSSSIANQANTTTVTSSH